MDNSKGMLAAAGSVSPLNQKNDAMGIFVLYSSTVTNTELFLGMIINGIFTASRLITKYSGLWVI